MKKIASIITLIIAISFLVINTSIATDDEILETIVEVSYEYKEDTNTVIATMTANNELKDTKISWELSEDKKQYIFEFADNTTYMTSVEDIYGRKIPVEINVTQVDEKPANIEVLYEYKEETNTVIATMVSSKELKPTKVSWKLSEDKKQYTFEFANNTTYMTNVADRFGNIIPVEINVTQIDESPANVEILYEYREETNTVIATMVSSKELKPTKISWKLSEDKKQYTFEFGDNTTYITNVVDIYGNTIPVEINVTEINTTIVEVTYEYKEETNTVIATMTSNNGFQDTKVSWKLSEDGKSYTFEFGDNTTYITNVVDKYGKVIPVQINVTQINTTVVEIKYQYKPETNTVLVIMTSNNEFRPTKKSWILSADRKQYTFEFANNTTYMTNFEDKYGKVIPVQINVNQVRLGIETGIYGQSGAKIHGISGGSDLEYLKFGYGENVLFATFCVHGYEDAWDRDGTVLVDIANNFYNRLVSNQDGQLAKEWTIYVFREVNPDGRRLGYTKDGPGRTTLYSKVGRGIDINRSWQTGSEYKTYSTNRNYNGTAGFQAYEAEALRDFMLSHKSKNGKTVLVDLHGWQEQLIGDEAICKYYKQQYTTCRTTGYGRYGTQYLITWGRQNLGAQVALVELPVANNYEEVNSMQLSDKYINATLEMLKYE